MAWIFREYGLKVEGTQIAHVRREYGIVTAGVRSWPQPEGLEPITVPPERGAAAMAAFRHFGMLN